MPKRAIAPGLVLTPRAPGEAAGEWLCAALRREILQGRLSPGARLPATRDLARQYGLARGTVVSAFAQLEAEGYLVGRVGAGTFVNAVLPDDLLRAPPPPRTPAPAVHTPRRTLSAFSRRVRLMPGNEPRPLRPFRANLPALDLFPTTLWAQVAGRRLRQATTGMLNDSDPLGYQPLREAVADYLRTSRGVQCEVAQVAIVSGAQEAVQLVARLLLDPGDRVCMENPGYTGAALVFEAFGARIMALPVDAEGMRLPGARERGARLASVTPAHQFPLGITMSLPRRLALLEWARATGALLLEDDYDGEYRYAGRPMPALQGLDRHGQVLFTGTFSKVLFPALRLGYLVLPPDLVEPVAALISISTRHAPVLDQAILCDFMVEGHFGRHVRRMRELYAERLGALLENGTRRFAGLLEITGVEAGLQTAGLLAPGLDAEAVAQAARARDVQVTPLGSYRLGGPVPEGLLLGFAAVDTRQIRRGVEDLARALEESRRSTTPRRGG